jgi:hypothetical protein
MTAARVELPGARRGSVGAGWRYPRVGVFVLVGVLIGALLSSCAGRHAKVATPPGPRRPPTSVAAPRRTTAAASIARRGGWLMSADGEIFAFGGAVGHGSSHGLSVNRPVVCMSSTPSGGGYWIVAADGAVFAFGDARDYGSTRSSPIARPIARPIVGMAGTPTGHGYWLVAANGAVFGFGDARSHGSLNDLSLNQPVVGIAPTPSGLGYWLVAADGGIFAFGDAQYYGSAHSARSARSARLNAPIIGIAPSPSGRGYRLAATDGELFAFGDARLFGSTTTHTASRRIVAFGTTPTGKGYWLTGADGTVFAYGDASPERDVSDSARGKTIIGMASLGEAGTCHAIARPADIAPPPGAIAGEGQWVASARPVGGEPVIFTTFLRDRAGLPAAGLAWIDANRVVFRLYAGTGQPPGTFLYSGFVDPSVQSALLATFNAGFKVNASEGGWAAYGRTAIPLRDGAASLVIRSDGTANVGMWGRDATTDPQVVAVRQNLTLLIDGGRVASDLSPASWGAVFGGGVTTWRSGLGVDANGHLIYVVGPDLLPSDLAHLLLAAGSERAMQLDINRVVSFSTFTTPTPSWALVGANLLPTINFAPTRYLHTSGRDFIAVFAR